MYAKGSNRGIEGRADILDGKDHRIESPRNDGSEEVCWPFAVAKPQRRGMRAGRRHGDVLV